jgi:hypothetical protein
MEWVVCVAGFGPEGRMPPCSDRSSTSRFRRGLRACLTGPARGSLPGGRSGRRKGKGQPSIEHRDGSCGAAFGLMMTSVVVERAGIAQPLQPPGSIVTYDEVGDRGPDLGGGAEGPDPDLLLLEGGVEGASFQLSRKPRHRRGLFLRTPSESFRTEDETRTRAIRRLNRSETG